MVLLRVGTSGFSYKEWKGSFYPEELPESEMLAYYASRLPAVEINNTFYRMPKRDLLERWAHAVPESFRFVLKAPRRITHEKRLRPDACAPDVAYLLETAAALGPKLGPILFQLPPFLRKDAGRLTEFLALLPAACRAAFEFRHASWADAEVERALRARGAALCIADSDEHETRPALVATAGWGYLRLRRAGYAEADLAAWAESVRAQPWSEAFVFFKHEDAGAGPALAAAFRALFGNPAAPS